MVSYVVCFSHQMEQEGGGSLDGHSSSRPQSGDSGPKRLHISNIPFRFREADLRNLLAVSIKCVLAGTATD